MQSGSILVILQVIFTVIIAMFFIEVGVFGYLLKPTSVLERILFVVGGLFLMNSTWQTDLMGFGVIAIAIASHLFLPEIPFIGQRPPDVEKVDLSRLDWNENESLLENLKIN